MKQDIESILLGSPLVPFCGRDLVKLCSFSFFRRPRVIDGKALM